MPSIVPIRRPWTHKPHHSARIAAKYRRGLVRYVPFNERQGLPRELFKRTQFTGSTGINWGTQPEGSISQKFRSNKYIQLNYTSSTLVTAGQDFTAIWVGVPQEAALKKGIWSIGSYAPGVFQSASTAGKWGIYWNGWYGNTIPTNVGILTVVVLRRVSGLLSLWVNGESAFTPTTKALSWGSSATLNIGTGRPANKDGDSDAILWGLYLHGWTDSLISEFALDLWGFFEPRTLWLSVPDAAGGPKLQSVGGTLSFGGNVDLLMALMLTGTLSFAGVANKSTSKSQSAALSFGGALLKRTDKILIGSLSFAGGVTKIPVFLRSVGGTLTFLGTISKGTFKAADGTLTFTGDESKQIQKTLSGTLTFGGALSRLVAKQLTGDLTFAGTLVKGLLLSKAVIGGLSFVGTLATLFVPPSGITIRRMWRSVWSRVWKDPGKKDEDT